MMTGQSSHAALSGEHECRRRFRTRRWHSLVLLACGALVVVVSRAAPPADAQTPVRGFVQEELPAPIPLPGLPRLPEASLPLIPVATQEQKGNAAEPPKIGEGKGEQAPGVDQLPGPKVLDGMPGRRFPLLGGPFGRPQPTQKDLEELNRFVGEVIDPKVTLDIALGRGRLIILKETPKRVQVVDEKIAEYNLVTPKEVTIIGKKIGTTNLNLWFVDPKDPTKERIISYLVRVLPDPEAKDRLERMIKALEEEINKAFPDSIVHLSLVGDKIMVTGQAHDIVEATNILRIVRSHAPFDENNRLAGDRLESVLKAGYYRPQYGIDQLRQLEGSNIINLLRIPGEQQVMLKVVVAEVNRSAARSIGVNFAVTNDKGTLVVANRTGNIATGGTNFGNFSGLGTVGTALGALATNNIPVALDNGEIKLAINALRNLNYARSLAEPNLVALNGQTATFHAGGEFPVPFVTGFTAAGLQGVNFVPFGVSLNFTPFITDKDRVRLQIAASVSTRDLATGTQVNGSNVPGLNTRDFQTTVELREGQTLAVAGLIQNNLGTDATRIPGIGDLPVLNWLTGFQRTSSAEQELVVLITPELVHPMEPHDVPSLPGSDLFEPSDMEFFVCGRLESRREYDYRSPVMTDLARMRRYHRCEQIYIFGPHGHSDEISGTVLEK
jgi:pilus assembly protein CpaC